MMNHLKKKLKMNLLFTLINFSIFLQFNYINILRINDILF